MALRAGQKAFLDSANLRRRTCLPAIRASDRGQVDQIGATRSALALRTSAAMRAYRDVASRMNGLRTFVERTGRASPIAHAAIASFGFGYKRVGANSLVTMFFNLR